MDGRVYEAEDTNGDHLGYWRDKAKALEAADGDETRLREYDAEDFPIGLCEDDQ